MVADSDAIARDAHGDATPAGVEIDDRDLVRDVVDELRGSGVNDGFGIYGAVCHESEFTRLA